MTAPDPQTIDGSPRRLAWVRAAWLLTALATVGLLLVSVPAYLAHLGLVTEVERIRLAVSGLPPDFTDPLEFWLDLASMIVQLASASACLALAAIIFWRRPGERMAIVLSFFLLVYGVVMVGPLLTLAELRLDWLTVVGALEAILFGGWAVLFYLFPDGQFVPRWTRWLCVGFVAWVATSLVFHTYLIPTATPEPGQVVVLAAWHMIWPVTSLAAQVYRYQRVSNLMQRQQTKWVLLAFALLVLVILSLAGPFLYSLFHPPANPLAGMPALARFYGPLWSILVSALPMGMGVAMLRFRLFDIDLFLNRSLVYGVLTAAVVAVYAVVVGVSGAIVQSSQPLAPLLLATVLILLIIQPLRAGLQRGVDRLIPLPAREHVAPARPAAWRGLELARPAWLFMAAIALAALLASIPNYIRLLGVFTEQEQFAARLMSMPGLFSPSPQFEFWTDVFYNALSFGAAALSLALSALVFWRRPRDPIAFVVSVTLLAYGILMAGPLEMLAGQTLAGQSSTYAAQMLLWGFFIFLFFIFPDGRFVPAWTRWFSLLLVPWVLGLALLQFYPIVETHWDLFFILYTGPSLAAPLAQFIRYRRVSNAVQRQQTKWVILGFTAWIVGGTAITGLLITLARQLVGPATTVTQPASLLLVLAGRLWWPLSLTFVPVTLTVSILRYRLFDIHVLINRALVYGGLSAGVVGLYVLVVGGLGALLQTSTPLAPVLLTAIGAALLFRPLRPRLQRGVDRVMYGTAGLSPQPATGLTHAVGTPAQPTPPTRSAAPAAQTAPARLSRWDLVFRGLAALAVGEIATLALNLMATPQGQGLIGQGLFARLWLGLIVSPLLLFFGGLILFRAPGNVSGRFLILVALGAVGMQFDFDWAPPAAAALAAIALELLAAGVVGPCLAYFMLTFPTGRAYPPAWGRWFVVAGVVKFIGAFFEILATPGKIRIFTPAINPLFVPALAPHRGVVAVTIGITGLLLPLMVLCGGLSLLLRYRAAPALVRQQIKWVVWGFGLMVPTGMVTFLTAFLYGGDSLPFQVAVAFAAAGQVALLLAIAIGILRYHLFDIDVLINRTLVYGSLTVIVVGVYVIAVGYLSQLFQASGSFVVSLLATGLIAVFFQPARERLQRTVNRLLYGERDDPYAVLSRLGGRLEATLAPEAVLPTLVETIAQTLKLPYVAITLTHQPQAEPQIAAAFGLPAAVTIRLPLSYQGEPVGELRIAPRGPGENFSVGEQKLLDDIAHQAGVAAHALRLTDDLQRSRERLVTAQEEERRRLRRDLHDGLGPQLASQTLTLTAALRLLPSSPAQAAVLLAEAIKHAQDAVTDIRRVVYGLRPPALDDLGLAGALHAQVAEFETSGVRFSVSVPESLPPLPAAVEVACYRIAQEALTNVVTHAQAQSCYLSLTLEPAALVLEVTDDGRGLPAVRRTGVGLGSMRERAEELGGQCSLEPVPAGGTRVLARLPIG
jgi:signal transduction histidine kinase